LQRLFETLLTYNNDRYPIANRTLKLTMILYSGGLESMFEGKKRLDLELVEESARKWTMEALIDELRCKHLKEKEEMFV
jgi:hypothetical protein